MYLSLYLSIERILLYQTWLNMPVSHTKCRIWRSNFGCKKTSTQFLKNLGKKAVILWNIKTNTKQKKVFSERLKREKIWKKKGIGAKEGTRTLTPCGTNTWSLRVYQFRHLRIDVIPMRVELMTTGFGNRYSIHLSYGIIIVLSLEHSAYYNNNL